MADDSASAQQGDGNKQSKPEHQQQAGQPRSTQQQGDGSAAKGKTIIRDWASI